MDQGGIADLYHLYSGTGTVSDTAGGTLQVLSSAFVSDQLLTQAGDPVPSVAGQPLPAGPFIYRIADWCVTVDQLASFFGPRGSIYVQLLNPLTIADAMWGFNGQPSGAYDWRGQVTFDEPDKQQWPNPSSTSFARLPRRLRCDGTAMGNAISHLFRDARGGLKLDLWLERVASAPLPPANLRVPSTS